MLITVTIVLLAILLAPILLIRFLERWVAAFNLAVTNRITGRFADRLPGFGVSYQLSSPTIVDDPTLKRFPVFVRIVLWLIGANDFMQR
jgi:hypothetical protein